MKTNFLSKALNAPQLLGCAVMSGLVACGGADECEIISKISSVKDEDQLVKVLGDQEYTVINITGYAWDAGGCKMGVTLKDDQQSIKGRNSMCFNSSLSDAKKASFNTAKTLKELELLFGSATKEDQGKHYEAVFNDGNYTMQIFIDVEGNKNGSGYFGMNSCKK